MSRRVSEAEEFELPSLGSSSLYVNDEEISHEAAGLLKAKEGREGVDGHAASSHTLRLDGNSDDDGKELIGKGSKVDQLIAEHVPASDDPTLPTLTLRVIIIGSSFCLLGASASQVFYFKSNAPSFSAYFVILATYPIGHAMANEKLVRRGRTFLGMELNPGPFSIKEAILISVLASSGATSAYAADILAIMDLYFHIPLPALPSIVLLLTTQCIGFGLAGMLQNLLVTPPAMYWPANLVTVQLFTTLYSSTSSALSRAALLATRDRLKVFTFIFLITFMYQFLPFLIFPTLTSVSVLCLLNNQSWWMRTLGSGYKGLGILDFSFDWSSIGSSGPLFTPYWALGNYFGGLIGMCWIVRNHTTIPSDLTFELQVTPLLLMWNFWDSRSYPDPMSSQLYNANHEKFDVGSVLNEDLSLNELAYEQNRPLLLTPYFAISYGLSFAALTSTLVHVWLWHRNEIKEAWTNRFVALDDVHNRLMRNYLPVPSSWYLGLLGINFFAAVVLVKTTPLQTPIWALVLSIVIAAIFLVPVGIIAAVSNTTIGLNVLTEFVAGILMPGKPIGNVTFKCFGYMAMSQSLLLTSDLKLGWYTSIPPREMFICQIIGTVLGVLANYVTMVSVITEKRPFLDGSQEDPTGQWTGRAPGIFYSASIIWGAVAPKRFFSGGYEVLYLGFLLGAIVPIVLYYAHRRWPGRKLNKVVFPIVCSGATLVPQYPTNIILTSAITAVVVNSWYAKRFPKSHSKYAYVVSSALDAGTSITALSIYLLFGVLTQWDGPRWWGNPTTDSEHCAVGT